MMTYFGKLISTWCLVVKWDTKNGKKVAFFFSFLFIYPPIKIQSRNQNLQIVRHVDYYQIYQNKNATFFMPKSWCTTYLPTERHMQVEKVSIHRSFHQTFNVIDLFFFRKNNSKGKTVSLCNISGNRTRFTSAYFNQVCCRKTTSFKTN